MNELTALSETQRHQAWERFRNVRRAIDIREGEAIDEDAFKALIRAAVSLNESSGRALKKRRNGA